MVSTSVMVSLVIQAVVSVGVPVVLLIYFYRKYRISMIPMAIGLAVFIVFSQILEKSLHFYVFQVNPETAEWLKNPFLYAVYGGLAAGVFEEIGRFIGFRYTLKKYREWKDGISYGIGHGGIEAFLLGGFGAIQALLFVGLINSGHFSEVLEQSGDAAAQLKTAKDQLVGTHSYMVLLGVFERVSAFVLQLGLSMLVLLAVRKKRVVLLLGAIFAHAAIDFVAVLGQRLDFSPFLIEGLMLIVAILSIIFVIKSKQWLAKNEVSAEQV
jgi:uncharacterized membrane protein YhfC